VSRDEVVAEGELGMPLVGVLDDVDVARDDNFTRSERPNDPTTGLIARADEVTRLSHVVTTRHFPIGDKEVGALAWPGGPHRGIGAPVKEICVMVLRPMLGVFRPGHGVAVELPLGGMKHVLPGEEAELPLVEIEVGEHREQLLAALSHVHALDTRRAEDDGKRRLGLADVLRDDGGVKVATAP